MIVGKLTSCSSLQRKSFNSGSRQLTCDQMFVLFTRLVENPIDVKRERSSLEGEERYLLTARKVIRREVVGRHLNWSVRLLRERNRAQRRSPAKVSVVHFAYTHEADIACMMQSDVLLKQHHKFVIELVIIWSFEDSIHPCSAEKKIIAFWCSCFFFTNKTSCSHSPMLFYQLITTNGIST